MSRFTERLRLAGLCVAVALAATPGFPAPPQQVTLSAHPVEAALGPPTRNFRGFFTGDGRSFAGVEPGGGLAVAAADGAPLAAGTGPVADAALLRLHRWGGLRPHAVWVGRGGIGLVALDAGGAAAAETLALPGRGGAARAAAATRLAVAEDGAGQPVILVAGRAGGVTALLVQGRYGRLRLRAAGHWSIGGGVTAIAADGPHAYIAGPAGIWSLDLNLPAPAPVREAASGSACLQAAQDLDGIALLRQGGRLLVAVAQPAARRIAIHEAAVGPDPCLGLVQVVAGSGSGSQDAVAPVTVRSATGGAVHVWDAARARALAVSGLAEAFPAR